MDHEALAFGRYVVRGHLGAGGMGEVLRAYDPKLDREVAIKIVKEPTATAAARLLREAKTLAAITHPNVVPVYDVATQGDDVFVAMELIEGQTLRAWLEHGRPWREVVDVFVRAAEGLDAAHRLGVVHRDFKPDNVMVELGVHGQVTRVRVMDFGLAVSTDDTESLPPSGGSSDVYLQSDRLTQTGAIVGTPSYLAPEGEAGAPGTPATDQFAFCVALYEGLYGQRPFVGDSHAALSRKKWAGEIEPPPADTPVPRALHDVVVRGLSAMPPERWPTMPALVDAMLDAMVVPPRPRWIAPAAVALCGGVVAAGVLATRDEPCADPDAILAAAWDDADRRAVRDAFSSTGLPFADASADRVVTELDDYGARWLKAWPSGCVAERARAQQACLRGRLAEVAAVSESFAQADDEVVRLSLEAVGALADPGACAFEDALVAVSPSQQAAAAEAQSLLQRAHAAKSLGRYDEAEGLADEAGRAAAEVDDCGLTARVLYLRAQLSDDRGDLDSGLELAESAYFEAQRCDAKVPALDAARFAMSMHIWGTRDLEAADVWYGHAAAALEQLGPGPEGQPDVDRAVLLYTHSHLLQRRGERDATLASLEEADALLRPFIEVYPDTMAEFLATRGSAVLLFEGPAAALPYYEEGLALAESHFGEQHPKVAIGYGNLGNNYQALGRLEEAEQVLRRTETLMPLAFGVTHPYVARAKNVLAQTLTLRDRWDEASAKIEEGLKIAAVTEPDGGPETLRLLGTRSAIAYHADDLESARADMQQIVDARESRGHFDGSAIWDIMKLAEYQIALGRLDEARYRLDQASEHVRTHLQDEEVLAAKIQGTYALLHAARKDYDAALDAFDEAKAGIAGTLGRESLDWAEIHEAHADTMLEMGRTTEARAMFETLAEIFVTIEMPADAERVQARIAQL